MKLYAFKLGAEYPVFTQEIEAKIDPVSGKYMIPAFATNVELIEDKEGFQRYFKESAWHYIEDNIGTEYFDSDGKQHKLEKLGEVLPEWALSEKPIVKVTENEQIENARSECTARINSRWNQLGQLNVALGIYTEAEKNACTDWVKSHLDAFYQMISDEDFLNVDVSEDGYWPV